MSLADFGYANYLNQFDVATERPPEDTVARVIAEHKEHYVVVTQNGELDAEITGNMRYSAQTRADFPAVGDWVGLQIYDEYSAVIHTILPRFSVLQRQAIGQTKDAQIIATNINGALLLQAVNRDFNLNRLERYLAICHASGVRPIIVLSKIDLITLSELADILQTLRARIADAPIYSISNETREGLELLSQQLIAGETYCLLGSSGVGKSSLLNHLAGQSLMKTAQIGQGNQRGKHITTHREMMVLATGAILIDNPGMREVGVTDAQGVAQTFAHITQLAQSCKFHDCQHQTETDCAVLEAIRLGKLDAQTLDNYHKTQREQAFFEASLHEKKQKDKNFGKMLKNFQKGKHPY